MDVTSIQAALGSVKAAKDIISSAVGLRDAINQSELKVELLGKLIEAQAYILAAQEEQAGLQAKTKQLEEETMRFKAWEEDKAKYEMVEVSSGVFAYALKESERGSNPLHKICANCYCNNKKSVLQAETEAVGRVELLVCHGCKSRLYVRGLRR